MTEPPRRQLWPWAVLAAAGAWVVVLRVPLVLNARNHLDSDLAVDGLTLLEATRGEWRWHYPGTPHIGTGGVFLSLPQAMAWGATPETLVSGGTVAFLGLMVGSFLLAWLAYGPSAAAWSVVPLAFASSGAVWLSGRITGGHLLAAVWHAGAFALLVPFVRRGGPGTAFALGLWCGVGLYFDSMFAVTLAGLAPVAAVGWFKGERRSTAVVAGLLGLALGVAPREVGMRVDPHNAYGAQFEPVANAEVLVEHGRLLVQDCLPRLIAGHRLPGFESDPDPTALTAPSAYRTPFEVGPIAVAATVVGLSLWGLASLAVVRESFRGVDRAGRLVAAGLTLSALATCAGFVANRNIFNSDNYRYLVCLLVPWSVGFGVTASRAWRSGRVARGLTALSAVALAGLTTADVASWHARFRWVDGNYRPIAASTADPLLDWLDANPDVGWVTGGYWDVYRLVFLTGGRVRGAPFPIYPNRFPAWRPGPGTVRALIARPTPEGRPFLDEALQAGGTVAATARGATIVRLP